MATKTATKFDDLLTAVPVEFYGVDNNMFRVKAGGQLLTFEAKEDESDGYRSMLEDVPLVANEGVFSRLPICRVTVRAVDTGSFDGFELVDGKGHIWLTFGTDDNNDYYPTFVFSYTPKPE